MAKFSKLGKFLKGAEKAVDASIVTKPHFIFSAENPLHPSKNILNLNTDQMITALREMGYEPVLSQGKYGATETSIIIPNITKKDAEALHQLAKDLGQDSSIFSTGKKHEMRYHHGEKAGSSIYGEGSVLHDKTPDDLYTQLPNGETFTHNFDFDKPKQSGKLDKKLVHYSRADKDLDVIDPAMQGTGMAGKEGNRVNRIPRSYYYEEGSVPEDLVVSGAKKVYEVDAPDKILDLASDEARAFLNDPRLKDLPNDEAINLVEQLAKEAGYQGYKNSSGPLPEVVSLFDKQVPTSVKPVDASTWEEINKLRKQKMPAGLAVGTAAGLGAAALNQEDAEASTRIIPRKVLDKILLESTEDGILNIPKLLEKMGIKANDYSSNTEKMSDLVGHTALIRLGMSEEDAVRALKTLYPESTMIQKGINSREIPNEWGSFRYDKKVFGGPNPKGGEIVYSPSLDETPTNLTGVLLHEGQHLRDTVDFPNERSTLIPQIGVDSSGKIRQVSDNPARTADILSSNPKLLNELVENYNSNMKANLTLDDLKKLSPADAWNLAHDQPGASNIYFKSPNLKPEEILQQYSGRHHIQYPKNYELEKTKELVEQGVKIPDKELQAKKMDDLEAKFFDLLNSNKKTAAGLAGAGIGAGLMIGDSNEAEASTQKFDRLKDLFNQPVDEFTASRMLRENESQVDLPNSPSEIVGEALAPVGRALAPVGRTILKGLTNLKPVLEPVGKVLEKVDKYTGKPVRNAANAALMGENPLDAAVSDKDTEGSEVSRNLLKRFEEAGLPLRAPGQEEYTLETPVGFAADVGLDVTNVALPGASEAAKFLKLKQMLGK